MEYYLEKSEIVKNKIVIEAWMVASKSNIEIDFGNNRKRSLTPNKVREDIAKYINNNNIKTTFSYSIPIPLNCKRININLKSNEKLLTKYIIETSYIKRITSRINKIGKIGKKIVSVLFKNPKILFSKELRNNYKQAMHDKYNDINNTDLLDINNQKDYVDWIVNNEKYVRKKNNNSNMSIFTYGNDKELVTIDRILDESDSEYVIITNSNDILSDSFFNITTKGYDFIYGDNDYLDNHNVRMNPHFKPDYSPDTLNEINYIGTTCIIKKDLLKSIKQKDFEINLDTIQDLYLKLLNKNTKINHIKEIIYHSKNTMIKPHHCKNYKVSNNPLVSIIIPTRDYKNVLEQCINSISNKTTYNNYEIIIVNNGSKEKETLELFDEYKKNDKITIIDLDCEFNFSYLNNEAVKECNGEYIVLLNNDTEIITPNWLELMLNYASQEYIGAVGAKLLYPDNTIQHAGVILGLGGIASHAYIGEKREYKGLYNMLTIPHNVSAVTAACLMIQKDKYLDVKGLDEKLKVAFNDVDFNIKLLEKGYYNIILPEVELYHYESKSRGLDTTTEKKKRFDDETNIMLDRWKKYIKEDPFYNPNFSLKRHYMLDRYKNKEESNNGK